MGWMHAREGAASKWTCCSALLLTRDPTSRTSLGLPLPHGQEMGWGWGVLRAEPSRDLLAGGAWHGVLAQSSVGGTNAREGASADVLGVGNFSRHTFEDRSAENSVSLLVPGLFHGTVLSSLTDCHSSLNQLPQCP